MNLINATLLLVHFLIMSNILCVCFTRVYVFYDFTFSLSVLCSLFCKHVRLSCVFIWSPYGIEQTIILVHGQVTIIFVVCVCLSVCLYRVFLAVFDPISIKLGHVLYVWV